MQGLAHSFDVERVTQPQNNSPLYSRERHAGAVSGPHLYITCAKKSLRKRTPLNAHIIISINVCLYFELGRIYTSFQTMFDLYSFTIKLYLFDYYKILF